MSEQGGDHEVVDAAFDQTCGERVAQIVWAQVFDSGPLARGGETYRVLERRIRRVRKGISLASIAPPIGGVT